MALSWVPVMALLLPAGTMAATPEPEAAAAASTATAEATLEIFNRDIITFRGPALGIPAADRARRAKIRVKEQLREPGVHKVTLQRNPVGMLVEIDGAMSFLVTADDADKLEQETVEAAAAKAAAALTAAIEATRESRSLDAIGRAVAISVAATAVLLGLLWVMRRARQALERWLVRVTEGHTERLRVSGVQLIHRERLAWLVHAAVIALQWLVTLLLLYEWISVVFAQFPYTRVWSERLTEFLIGTAAGIGNAIVGAIPGLFIAVVIFLLARFASRVLDGFFERVQSGQLQVSWLDSDVALLTRRLAMALLWLFALAMAYPYLPGAHTEAFRGLSVLLGLMLSLGASNLVGQAASGLILTYSHVYRHGEYVRIAEHEGTVTELGMFATRLRTGLGEELTLSNSLILGAVTRNYSRAVRGPGFVLDTVATIGYDTPWRQVDAMLVEAALRTPGVLADPPPRVFQTGLSDFYPEYRLVCQAIPSEPRPRAVVLSMLHANIQDVFNEHGVQIMSPHYLGDPAAPKTVPKEHWFTAPARPPDA
jgi:small-conductance mechanosensitive channel